MLRADPQRQGRRPGRADAADLAGLGDRPRHQGRELDADRRMAGAVRPRAAVRSDQCAERRLQPVARSAPRRMGGSRRPEHRGRAGRSGGRAGTAEPLGENQPFAAGRHDPACPLRRAGQDARRRRQLPLRPQAPDRDDAARDDDDAASGRTRRASRRRQRRARASEQERERTLRRAVDRHVVPRPLSRSRGRGRNAPVRLAHPRSCRRRSARDPLPRRAALRHQPHQAAHSADPQPDWPTIDGRTGSRSAGAIACC